MGVSAELVESMDREAQAWWKTRGAFEKARLTGATNDKEAERRFQAACIADRWHLSQGHIETLANFNWGTSGKEEP